MTTPMVDSRARATTWVLFVVFSFVFVTAGRLVVKEINQHIKDLEAATAGLGLQVNALQDGAAQTRGALADERRRTDKVVDYLVWLYGPSERLP